jgi:hypothetical protein
MIVMINGDRACTLLAGGVRTGGAYAEDGGGNRTYSFANKYELKITADGGMLEVEPPRTDAPADKRIERRTLLTPEGVLLKIYGSTISVRLPNGVLIDEYDQIKDSRGSWLPDNVRVEPDGTRVYSILKDTVQMVYTIKPNGLATVEEKRFARGLLLNHKTTKWTLNSEIQINTRQHDTELRIRGVFVHEEGKEFFKAPNGSIIERTPAGTIILRIGNRTRSLKHRTLKIKNELTGEETEYRLDGLQEDGSVPGDAQACQGSQYCLSDGTGIGYTTVVGDMIREERSNCLYLSTPNHRGGRDHFFVRPHSMRLAYVSSTLDLLLDQDYRFDFGRRIFEG